VKITIINETGGLIAVSHCLVVGTICEVVINFQHDISVTYSIAMSCCL